MNADARLFSRKRKGPRAAQKRETRMAGGEIGILGRAKKHEFFSNLPLTNGNPFAIIIKPWPSSSVG